MMSLWDALRMNMMISYQELVRTFLKQTLFAHQPAKIHKPYPTNKMQTTSGKKVIQDR